MQELSEGLAPGEDPLFYKVAEPQEAATEATEATEEPESEPPSDARKEYHGPSKPRRSHHLTIEVDKVKIAESARDPSRRRATVKMASPAAPPPSAEEDVFKKLPPTPLESEQPAPSSDSPWSERGAAPLPKEALPSSGAPAAVALDETAASAGVDSRSGGSKAVWPGAAVAVVVIGGGALIWSQMGSESSTETTGKASTSQAATGAATTASPSSAASPSSPTAPSTAASATTAASTDSAATPSATSQVATASRTFKPATATKPATKPTMTSKPKTTSEYIPGANPTF